MILASENCSFTHLVNAYANPHILYLLCVSTVLGTGDTVIINKTDLRAFFSWTFVLDGRTMKKVNLYMNMP